MNAHVADTENENKNYDQLVQKIYSNAKAMGYEDLIEQYKEDKSFGPSRLFEENSKAFAMLEQYNEDNFWEELITRMAERDVQTEAEAEGNEIESAEKFFEQCAPLEMKYAEEFAKNGLDNIKLVNKTPD